MTYFLMLLLSIQLGLLSASAFGGPGSESDVSGVIIEHPSYKKCRVHKLPGKISSYRVLIEGHTEFAPLTNGISAIQFSSSGKYLALSGGMPSLIDVLSGRREYGLVIVNCENGKVRGYLKNTPAIVQGWDGDRAVKIVKPMNLTVQLP